MLRQPQLSFPAYKMVRHGELSKSPATANLANPRSPTMLFKAFSKAKQMSCWDGLQSLTFPVQDGWKPTPFTTIRSSLHARDLTRQFQSALWRACLCMPCSFTMLHPTEEVRTMATWSADLPAVTEPGLTHVEAFVFFQLLPTGSAGCFKLQRGCSLVCLLQSALAQCLRVAARPG